MSYSRNDAPAYPPSPAVEQSVAVPVALTHSEAMERFNVSGLQTLLLLLIKLYQNLGKDLEAVLIQLPMQSLAALPPNHDVRNIVRQILYLAAESSDRHRTPLLMSQKIVQLLYKTSQQLTREVYVVLLDQLCRTFEDVAKEAITWLIYADDEVCFYLWFRPFLSLMMTLGSEN